MENRKETIREENKRKKKVENFFYRVHIKLVLSCYGDSDKLEKKCDLQTETKHFFNLILNISPTIART